MLNLLRQTSWFLWHRGVRFCGVIDIVEIRSVESDMYSILYHYGIRSQASFYGSFEMVSKRTSFLTFQYWIYKNQVEKKANMFTPRCHSRKKVCEVDLPKSSLKKGQSFHRAVYVCTFLNIRYENIRLIRKCTRDNNPLNILPSIVISQKCACNL